MNRRILARVLAAGYRNRGQASAFIAEALDEEMSASGWIGAARVVRLCVADIVASRLHPRGLPITAAHLTNGRAASLRSNAMDHLIQDVRFGVRQLRRQPGFALIAILTMALGVGANTAIFSIAWQTMLKPLPYRKSQQLVEIWETNGTDARINPSMPAKFHDLRHQAKSFQYVAAYSGLRTLADLTGGGDPRQLQVRRVSADYFNVFGMAPLIGRPLDAADAAEGSTAVVISEDLWRDRFQSTRDILKRQVTLAGAPAVIVGVMPAAFAATSPGVDVWTPLILPPETERKTGHYLRVIGRLADGVTIAQADAEAKAISARAAKSYPELEGKLSAYVTSLIDGRGTTRGDAGVRSGLELLTMAAAVLLLIACANLASLQLARAVARGREFGIRAALGASRARVIGQLLTEGVLIAVLGTALGLLIGAWVLELLSSVAPPAIAAAAKVRPDGAVILYALALAAISAIAFALAPAWRAASGATRWLRQRAEMGDRGSAKMRLGLVTGQIAAAAILLTGAALLVASLSRVMNVSPGFQPDGALTFDVSMPPAQYDTLAKQLALFQALGDRIEALPGVTAVCGLSQVPFDTQNNLTYVPEGRTEAFNAFPHTVTGDCLGALGIAVTRGRALAPTEREAVAVVSEGFAKTAWPGEDPVGKRMHLGVVSGPLVEVVGVARDIMSNSLEGRPNPQVYQAWNEHAWFVPEHIIVRTATRPDALFPAIRAAVRDIDADQTVARLRTMNEVVARTTSSRRFDLTLLGSFALVALLLSAVGVYGLLSQVVAQRAPEIGIRLALGATPGSVVRLMLNHAALALSIALPLGIGGAVLASRLFTRFMFKMSATDPSIYAAVAGALAAVVLFASWLPARRAARVDPAQSVRA
jgi:putative ABC transport system permease protein